MPEPHATEGPDIRHEPRLRWLLKDIAQVLAVILAIFVLLTFIIPEMFQFFGLKIFGIFLILFGIFLVKEFPDIQRYQSDFWSWSGIILGLALIIIGIILLFL